MAAKKSMGRGATLSAKGLRSAYERANARAAKLEAMLRNESAALDAAELARRAK